MNRVNCLQSRITMKTCRISAVFTSDLIIIIALVVVHTFISSRKVVTSEAVAEQVKSLVSVIKQVSFKPRFEYR